MLKSCGCCLEPYLITRQSCTGFCLQRIQVAVEAATAIRADIASFEIDQRTG